MRAPISVSVLPLTLFASHALAVNLRRGGYGTTTCTSGAAAGALSDTFPTPSLGPVVPTTTSCTTTSSSTPPPQADMGNPYITTPSAIASTGADTAPSVPVIQSQPSYGALPSSPGAMADPAADNAGVTTAFIDLSTTVTFSEVTTTCITSTLITAIPTVSIGYSTVQTVIPYTASYVITSQQLVTTDVTIVQTSFTVMVYPNASQPAAATVGADSFPTVAADPHSTPTYNGTAVVLPSAAAGFDNASAAFSRMATTPTDATFKSSVLPTAAGSPTSPLQQMTNDASQLSFGKGAILAAVAAVLGMGFF